LKEKRSFYFLKELRAQSEAKKKIADHLQKVTLSTTLDTEAMVVLPSKSGF
jgi:hypothetical protein